MTQRRVEARRPRLRLAAHGALAIALACAQAAAQTRQPPLPPPRPQTGVAAPQPSQIRPARPSPAPAQEPLDPDHPPVLPQASRAKMRDCGRAWEALKKAGKDGDIGWRAFATDCLTR